MLIPYLLAAVTAAAIAWFSIRLLIPVLRRSRVIDVPNARSSHSSPIPRGGGFGVVLALAAGMAAAALSGAGHLHWTILAGAAVVAVFGAADDVLGGVPVSVRFLIQFLMAALVVYSTGGLSALPFPDPLAIPLGPAGSVVAVLWIVGVTNVFNFLDGIDGFAGAQAVIAGVAMAVIAPDSAIAASAVALAGASAGFLAYNWHPARVFMGDAGSTTIGFLLAAMPFGAERQMRPLLIFYVLLFLWFFLADGVFTMGRRLLRGEALWRPHRSHLYQELAKAGLAHDAIVVRVMGMAVVVSVAAVLSAPALWLPLIVAALGFAIYVYWVEATRRRSS